MNKKIIILGILIMSFTFFIPKETNALQLSSITDSIYLLDEDMIDVVDVDDDDTTEDETAGGSGTQNCQGSDSLLGDPNDEDSVAWLLQQLLNFIKIGGPLIVVVLSSIDFAKVIVNGDDEGMQKAFKKLGQRLALAAALFFIPIIVQALLDVFGIMSDSTCGLS